MQYGRLALQRASNSEVKNFAQLMIRDHSRALQEVKTLASQKRVALPSQPPAKAKAAMANASRLRGTSFDAKYKADMIKMHREDIAKAQREARTGRDSQVRALARKSATLFQQHLNHALNLNVGGSTHH